MQALRRIDKRLVDIDRLLLRLVRHLGAAGFAPSPEQAAPNYFPDIRAIMRSLNKAPMKAAPKNQKGHPKPKRPRSLA